MNFRSKIAIPPWHKLCATTILPEGWWQVSDLTGERRVAIFKNSTSKIHVYPSGRMIASSKEAGEMFAKLLGTIEF